MQISRSHTHARAQVCAACAWVVSVMDSNRDHEVSALEFADLHRGRDVLAAVADYLAGERLEVSPPPSARDGLPVPPRAWKAGAHLGLGA